MSAVPTFYPEFTAIPGCHLLAQARESPDLALLLLSIEGPIHHHARETVDKITQLSHPWIIRKRTAQGSAVYVAIQSHKLQVMFALSAANSSLSDL